MIKTAKMQGNVMVSAGGEARGRGRAAGGGGRPCPRASRTPGGGRDPVPRAAAPPARPARARRRPPGCGESGVGCTSQLGGLASPLWCACGRVSWGEGGGEARGRGGGRALAGRALRFRVPSRPPGLLWGSPERGLGGASAGARDLLGRAEPWTARRGPRKGDPARATVPAGAVWAHPPPRLPRAGSTCGRCEAREGSAFAATTLLTRGPRVPPPGRATPSPAPSLVGLSRSPAPWSRGRGAAGVGVRAPPTRRGGCHLVVEIVCAGAYLLGWRFNPSRVGLG